MNTPLSDLVFKYFPELHSTEREKKVLDAFDLYKDWNTKINVISRKDFDSFYEKHFLHSLSIAKFIQFSPGSKILDIGTGGGFPGIPLAIFFPDVEFHLVDSIAKKIAVVADVAKQLDLSNVKAECIRCEELSDKYDFVTSRAVAPAQEIVNWNHKNVSKVHKNKVANGFIFLKGGDLAHELKISGYKAQVIPLTQYFEEPFFAEEKKLVYLSQKVATS